MLAQMRGMPMRLMNVRFSLVLLGVLSLAACGGSSGGGSGGNTPPQAIAGPDRIASGGDPVTLIGTASDADGNDSIVTLVWNQIAGPAVDIAITRNGTTQISATFVAPTVVAPTTLTFELSATDNSGLMGSDDVNVVVNPAPSTEVPVVSAGSDLIATAGQSVRLEGEAVDPDGEIVSRQWSQVATGAPQVTLTSQGDGSVAIFTAPNVTVETRLDFRFSATDNASPPNTASDDMVVTLQPLPLPAGPTKLFVSLNGPSNENIIQTFVESTPGFMDYVAGAEFTSIDNEGIALDIMGNATHIGDDDDLNFGGFSTLCRLDARGGGATFADEVRDRDVRGINLFPVGTSNSSGLGKDPGGKGVTMAHERGLVIVANNGGQNVKAFGSAVEHDIGALITASTGARPWDVAYDEDRDILYVAATNGTIRVLDSFVASVEAGASALETRVMRIFNSGGARIARNLHGIAYEPAGDRLVVSDVGATVADGAPGANGDGALYIFDGVRNLNGDVVPRIVIQGTSTGLGDPVDVVLNGRDLLVAEKANDKILLFRNIFTSSGGNVFPSSSIDIATPEALALQLLNMPPRPAVTDISSANTAIGSLLLSVSIDGQPTVVRLNPNLGAQNNAARFSIPGGAARTYGLVLDTAGDGYLLGEDPGDLGPNFGTLYVISRLAKQRTPGAGGAFDPLRDREMNDAAGEIDEEPQLQSPRGVDIDLERGLLFVTDVAPNLNPSPISNVLEIEVISLCGTGDILARVSTSPENTDTDFGADLDFDPETGDLYVAMRNGKVAIFRNFAATFQLNPPPLVVEPQRIGPLGLTQAASTDLRGIEYIGGSADTLIVSDVGNPGSDSDGQILILRNARNMSSTKLVDATISGGQTNLGNPVSLAYNGKDLYVLDQIRQMVLRFNNVLTRNLGNTPPDAITNTGAFGGTPQSLIVVPDYLSERPAQQQ